MTLNEYLTLIPSAHQDKPKFMALLSAVLQQVMDLKPMVDSLVSGFDLQTAVGTQLDALGAIAGAVRNANESDTNYRSRIQNAILHNRWRGTNEDLVALLTGTGFTFKDNQNMTMNVSNANVPKPAGIKMIV